MGERQRNGRVWGTGEGWATVICRSINCRPGRGHRGLLLWPPQEYLHSPTLALTREAEIVEPRLFAPGGGGEPGQRHHISDRGLLAKGGSLAKSAKRGGHYMQLPPPLQFCWKCPNNSLRPRVWRRQLKNLAEASATFTSKHMGKE